MNSGRAVRVQLAVALQTVVENSRPGGVLVNSSRPTRPQPSSASATHRPSPRARKSTAIRTAAWVSSVMSGGSSLGAGGVFGAAVQGLAAQGLPQTLGQQRGQQAQAHR